jgi:signal peptidase II
MAITRKLRITLLLLLLVGTVGCDQTTKHVARSTLGQSDSITLPGGWGELRLVENPGAFLSMGANLPPSVRVTLFTLGVATGLLLLCLYLVSRARFDWTAFTGLALVLAGGVSNLIDRILREGLVTDFITIRVGPFQTGVFNAADVAVLLGVGLLAFGYWRQARKTVTGRPGQTGV